METAQYGYGADLRSSDKKRLEKKLKADSDHIINKAYGDLSITNKKLEKEHDEILSLCNTDEEVEVANREFEEKEKPQLRHSNKLCLILLMILLSRLVKLLSGQWKHRRKTDRKKVLRIL